MVIGMGIYSEAFRGCRDGVHLRKQPGKWGVQPGSRVGLVDGNIKGEGCLAHPPRGLVEGSLVTRPQEIKDAPWLSRILTQVEQCRDEHRPFPGSRAGRKDRHV